MQLFFAESCGRWGCTWQENLISLIIISFPGLLLFLLPTILFSIVILIVLIEKLAEVLGFKIKNSKNLFSPLTVEAAKFIWKRREKIPVEKQKQILNAAKKLSEPKTRQLINQTATNLAQQYIQKNKNAKNVDSPDEQQKLQTESNEKIVTTDNEKIEVNNEVEEKGKAGEIIDRAANELAKNYLEQETKNTQNSVNTSDSKTRKAITQTAKAIAKAYLEETSEKEEKNSETEVQTRRKFRMLGNATRSLTKKYLNDNKQ